MRFQLRAAAATAALLLTLAAPRAQNLPQFDVATLKLSPPPTTDSISIVLGAFQNGRLRFVNATLDDMVLYAFALPSRELLVGLDWSDSLRFDVEARTAADAPPAQLRLMTQRLLKERLHLTTRSEQRTIRHAALLIDGNGPKMKPSTEPPAPVAQLPGRLDHKRMSMTMLVGLLSRFEQMPVVDRTGLDGFYELQLEWTPTQGIAQNSPVAASPDKPSLSTAVREQLGLRLENRRAPLDVVIIEQASRTPDPN